LEFDVSNIQTISNSNEIFKKKIANKLRNENLKDVESFRQIAGELQLTVVIGKQFKINFSIAKLFRSSLYSNSIGL
jgi:hypothetical protein